MTAHLERQDGTALIGNKSPCMRFSPGERSLTDTRQAPQKFRSKKELIIYGYSKEQNVAVRSVAHVRLVISSYNHTIFRPTNYCSLKTT